MIFRNPKLGKTRRRFLWWPRRICIIEGDYEPELGAILIPYTPGFHTTHTGVPASYYGRSGTKKKPTPGGTVLSPVKWVRHQRYDGWYWLEWVAEEFMHVEERTSDKSKTAWVIFSPRRQWNIFYEYE